MFFRYFFLIKKLKSSLEMLETSCWQTVYLQPTSEMLNCFHKQVSMEDEEVEILKV